jgi:hypothetical protein
MGSSIGSLLKGLLPFSAICVVLHMLVLHQFSIPATGAQWVPPLFFTLLSLLLLAWQESADAGDAKAAIRRFMSGMVLKMFGSLTLLLVVALLLPRTERLAFAIAFMAYYLAHLAFAAARMTRSLGGPHPRA